METASVKDKKIREALHKLAMARMYQAQGCREVEGGEASGSMSRCPCGCRKPVKPGKTWASSGCNGRVYFKARTPEQCREAVRIREATMTPAAKRRRLEIMVGEQRARRWELLMERWLQTWEDDGDPREALRDAYKHGYGAGQSRDRRLRELEKRAAAERVA